MTTVGEILKFALPKITLGKLGDRNSDICLLVDYLKTISNIDLVAMRGKVAKSRQRSMLLTDMRWFVRSESFAAINAEIERRVKENIRITGTPTTPSTVRYRRHVPVSR